MSDNTNIKVLDETPQFWGYRHNASVKLSQYLCWFTVDTIDWRTKKIKNQMKFTSIDTAKEYFYKQLNFVSMGGARSATDDEISIQLEGFIDA